MSMLEHLQRLFRYDYWANREILTVLETLASPPQRPLNLLGHIVSAERLWLERLLLKKQTLPVWPLFTIAQCKLEVEELPTLWRNYLNSIGESGLTRSLSYKNTKGEAFSSQKQDVLMHVVMHSAYHRGQIAAEMRAGGFTPAYTDFIHAVRQGFVD